MKKKLLTIITAVIMIIAAVGCEAERGNASSDLQTVENRTVTLLYTNDIHAYMDNDLSGSEYGLTYAHLAQMKKELVKKGENVLVADAGDHVQGSVYGALDSGRTCLAIMNEIYDVSAVGNHEFDYGMESFLSFTESAEYPYLSCNFISLPEGKTVLEAEKIIEISGIKVGFVGVTTPEAISSTSPAYFQDGEGNFIYDILSGEDMYAAVQTSIDSLKEKGAEYIIALGHMGVDGSSTYKSYDVIANVSGLDAFIDGHSHTELEKELVKDESGNEVLLTQTGSYFGAIGKMTLSEEGIETELVKAYDSVDKAIAQMKNDWVAYVEAQMGETVALVQDKLYSYDGEGKRIVRVKESNLGDFVADSYYYYINGVEGLNCDIAFINGGGLRAEINAGELSYLDLKAVNPFGNVLCIVKLSGRQILDALEWGSRFTLNESGQNETGAFMHVSGLRYKINTETESTVVSGDDEEWVSAPTGEYRVSDVYVYDKETEEYLPLDLNKSYSVVGANFTLRSMGDGYTMLQGELVKDYIVEDYMAIAAYAKAFADTNGDGLPDISSQNSPLYSLDGFDICYEDMYGAGRIEIE